MQFCKKYIEVFVFILIDYTVIWSIKRREKCTLPKKDLKESEHNHYI